MSHYGALYELNIGVPAVKDFKSDRELINSRLDGWMKVYPDTVLEENKALFYVVARG